MLRPTSRQLIETSRRQRGPSAEREHRTAGQDLQGSKFLGREAPRGVRRRWPTRLMLGQERIHFVQHFNHPFFHQPHPDDGHNQRVAHFQKLGSAIRPARPGDGRTVLSTIFDHDLEIVSGDEDTIKRGTVTGSGLITCEAILPSAMATQLDDMRVNGDCPNSDYEFAATYRTLTLQKTIAYQGCGQIIRLEDATHNAAFRGSWTRSGNSQRFGGFLHLGQMVSLGMSGLYSWIVTESCHTVTGVRGTKCPTLGVIIA